MSELTDNQLRDLCSTATERVWKAVDSVDQLIEDPQDTFTLLICVAASVCAQAANHLGETAVDKNGNELSPMDCLKKVFTALVETIHAGNQKPIKASKVR
jgi:hypothetical protein